MISLEKVLLMTCRSDLAAFCRENADGQVHVQTFGSLKTLVQVVEFMPEELLKLVLIDVDSIFNIDELVLALEKLAASVLRKIRLLVSGCLENRFIQFICGKTVPVIQYPCSSEKMRCLLFEKSIKKVIQSVYEIKSENSSLKAFIGSSEAIRLLRQKAILLAENDCSVLIQGETGTGKTFLAELFHKASRRKNNPLVYLNMANLTPETCDAELFGTDKSAYTGAVTKEGLVSLAHGGYIFLDEIGETSPEVQAKLLDFIPSGRFRRKGEVKERFSDVKFIYCTNADLTDLMKKGKFRRDLYFRIAENVLQIPSLDSRKEDIPLLAQSFLLKYGMTEKRLSEQALEFLMSCSWPGNVRQLASSIASAVMLSEGNLILPEHFF